MVPRARTLILVALAVTAAVMAGALVALGSGPTVAVSSVDLASSGGCAIDEQSSGFSLAPGAEEQFVGTILNDGTNTCSITGIQSETPGFTVVSSNVPLKLSPGVGTLTWVVRAPLAYRGALAFNFTGSMSVGNASSASTGSCSSPCLTTHVPSGLYQFHYGEVLPVGWLLVAAGSGGAALALLTLPSSRRR